MGPDLQRVTAILQTLVGFATVSRDSNLALIAWVEEYVRPWASECRRVHEGHGKSSLLVRVGPDRPGGIVLSGHSDVVPVDGQPWHSDPFTLTSREDRYYGRGTADMKSFLAIALAWLPAMAAQPLKRPLWLAISHDEEIGCLAAQPIAQAIVAAGIAPTLLIVGEPTGMQLVGAHKAIHSFETVVHGHEAHSSMPLQGVNAVMILGELMAVLTRIALDAQQIQDARYAAVTPYTSVHIGVIEGGTARNIIPRFARMAWEVRPLPDTDVAALLAPFHARAAQLEAEAKARVPQAAIETRAMTNVRGLEMAPADAAHWPLAMRLSDRNRAEAVAYGCEAGIFQGAGLPVVICGPGSIDQAHQPNEYIEAEQLTRGVQMLARVAQELLREA